MADVVKSVLVEHPAASMFALVDAVEDYPQFLPWCGGTQVLERRAEITRATIHIDFHGVKQSFTTCNRKEEPEWMHIGLEHGPFSRLEGHWRFQALAAHACRVELRLHYQFSTKLLEKVVGPVFGRIANSLVEAFVARADRLNAAAVVRR